MNGGLVGTKAVTKDYPVESHVCDFKRDLWKVKLPGMK